MKIPGLLLEPEDYEAVTGRSFSEDFDPEKRKGIWSHLVRGRQNKTQKIPIPSNIKWAVWERDNFTCQRCGSRKDLTVDHVYPESKGGEMTMENAQTLCKSCNSRKGAR